MKVTSRTAACDTDHGRHRSWATQIMGDTDHGRHRSWATQIMGDTDHGRHRSWTTQIMEDPDFAAFAYSLPLKTHRAAGASRSTLTKPVSQLVTSSPPTP